MIYSNRTFILILLIDKYSLLSQYSTEHYFKQQIAICNILLQVKNQTKIYITRNDKCSNKSFIEVSLFPYLFSQVLLNHCNKIPAILEIIREVSMFKIIQTKMLNNQKNETFER